MVFLIAEKIRGRPLPESALSAGTWLGILLLLMLMVYVMFQDLSRIVYQVLLVRARGPAMGTIWDRIEVRAGGPVVRETGTPLEEILRRLEGGEGPRRVGEVLGLTPADLIAALAHAGLGEEASGGPGLVRARREGPGWPGRWPKGPGSPSSPMRPSRPGWAWRRPCCKSTTSGTRATTPPSRPTTSASATSRPTGTRSPTVASPTPATHPTGSAASARTRSSPPSHRPRAPCSMRTATPP